MEPMRPDCQDQRGYLKTPPATFLCSLPGAVYQGCRQWAKPLSTGATCLCIPEGDLHFPSLQGTHPIASAPPAQDQAQSSNPISVLITFASSRISSTKARSLIQAFSCPPYVLSVSLSLPPTTSLLVPPCSGSTLAEVVKAGSQCPG